MKVNRVLFQPFAILNGTSQGFPLSSLLLVLVMKALLYKVRANPNIARGIVGNMEHKLAAFADDVLFLCFCMLT